MKSNTTVLILGGAVALYLLTRESAPTVILYESPTRDVAFIQEGSKIIRKVFDVFGNEVSNRPASPAEVAAAQGGEQAGLVGLATRTNNGDLYGPFAGCTSCLSPQGHAGGPQ